MVRRKLHDLILERPCYLASYFVGGVENRLLVRLFEVEIALYTNVADEGSSNCKYLNFDISEPDNVSQSRQWVNQSDLGWKYKKPRFLNIDEKEILIARLENVEVEIS